MSRPFHWFQGDSVRELRRQLNDIDPDAARLEVHQTGDDMFFRITWPAEAAGAERRPIAADINESHHCPPDC